MKILVLAPHEFYVDRGTPMDTDLLVRALSARGHEVDLVVYRSGADRTYPGVTLHRARSPRWLRGIRPGFSWKKVLADLGLFVAARRLVSENRYDVVHASEEASFMALWFRVRDGLPYIYDMDSAIAQQMIESRPWLRPLKRFFEWCEARAIQGSIAAAPVCSALEELALDRGAEHVVTLHDISQLEESGTGNATGIRNRLGLRDSLLMYVGNFEHYQGVDLLLRAFAVALEKGASADLLLAGGTPSDIERYRTDAERLGIGEHTHFIGPWPAPELADLLAEADILVSPRTKGINTPMKVFPFLHSEKPLLATDIRSHNQILTGDIAYLAPPDPAGLADGIVELCANPQLRQRLGQAGRRFVERNHTYPAHQARVDALYQFVSERLAAGRIVSISGADYGRGSAGPTYPDPGSGHPNVSVVDVPGTRSA